MYSCYWLAIILSICQAAHTDTAGIYDPVLPHRRIPSQSSRCYPYPYYSDYDSRKTRQQVRRTGTNSSPSQPQSQPPSTPTAEKRQWNNIPSRPSAPTRPYFYRYPNQYQRPASGFHAANQVEFLGPVQTNGNPPKFNYKRPNRPHPRPTCTIQGLGGGGSSSG